jgi:hypothetical protein
MTISEEAIEDDVLHFDKAAAGLAEAVKQGDIEDVVVAQRKAAASLQQVLENFAGQFGLSSEQMCTLTIMAVSNMAEDIDPDIRGEVAKMGASIDLKFVLAEVVRLVDTDDPVAH